MPQMSQVVCPVFSMHYLIYPSLQLCELSAKEFELHLINLEGWGSTEGLKEESFIFRFV